MSEQEKLATLLAELEAAAWERKWSRVKLARRAIFNNLGVEWQSAIKKATSSSETGDPRS